MILLPSAGIIDVSHCVQPRLVALAGNMMSTVSIVLCKHTRSKSHVPTPSTSHIHARSQNSLSYSLSVGHLCALKSPCLAVCIVAEVLVPLPGHTRTAIVSGRIHRSSLSGGMLSAAKDKCPEHPTLRAPLLEVGYKQGLVSGRFLLKQALGCLGTDTLPAVFHVKLHHSN